MGALAAGRAVAAMLKAAGVRAAVDARNVNAPGAWVTCTRISSPAYLCGASDATVDVYLIAPDNGTTAALETLDQLLADALEILDVDGDIETDHAVTLPNSPAPLPAYRLTTEVEIEVNNG